MLVSSDRWPSCSPVGPVRAGSVKVSWRRPVLNRPSTPMPRCAAAGLADALAAPGSADDRAETCAAGRDGPDAFAVGVIVPHADASATTPAASSGATIARA